MSVAHSAEQLELKRRARALAETIMAQEEGCEAEQSLPMEVLESIRERTLELSLQAINMPVADSAVDIALNRALLYQVAAEADAGLDRKVQHAKAAIVKLAASAAARRVVDRAGQIFGGRGYMRQQPVERLYRDARDARVWEGTSEIQRLVLANEIRKRGVDGLIVPSAVP